MNPGFSSRRSVVLIRATQLPSLERATFVAAARTFLILAAIAAIAFGWSSIAAAQTDGDVRQAQWRCLKEKFPETSLSGDGRTAFDPESERNFAYEGDAWIDVKTGESICPVTARLLRQAYWNCLKKKFPDISLSGDGKTAFDSESERNFAYEDGAWIDVKTGESICPKRPRTAGGPRIELELGFGDRRRTDGENTLFGGGERDRPCSGIGIGGFGIGGCAGDE